VPIGLVDLAVPMSSQSALPDVQSEITHPARPEILAGIDRVRIRLALGGGRTATAIVTLSARVPEGHRGVHMSRLYRLLAPDGLDLPLEELGVRLEAGPAPQERISPDRNAKPKPLIRLRFVSLRLVRNFSVWKPLITSSSIMTFSSITPWISCAPSLIRNIIA